jgi:hypothetical protein
MTARLVRKVGERKSLARMCGEKQQDERELPRIETGIV